MRVRKAGDQYSVNCSNHELMSLRKRFSPVVKEPITSQGEYILRRKPIGFNN